LGKAYKFANNLSIHTTHSNYDLGCLNYSLFSSFVMFIIVQCRIAQESSEIWLSQLIQISLLYLSQRVLLKCFTIVSIWEKVQNSAYIIWSDLLSILFRKFNEMWSKFDIVDGISCAIPTIFIGFAYMGSNPFIFLPIIMISLYIFAIIDKHRMIKYCAPIKHRSADYMLRTFKVYRWDCFCIFFGSFITVIGYSISVSPEQDKDMVGIAIAINLTAILFAYICWPEPLHSRAKKKFYEKNTNVRYETVSSQFSSLYQDAELIHENYKGNTV